MEFGPTQLRLRVLDTSLVKWAAATAMSLDGTPANVELPATNGSLTPSVNTCGELFLELWASDPAGFPVASCHYTAEYTIAGTGVREFWVTFDQHAGLKGDTTYTFVLVAWTSFFNLNLNTLLISADVFCPGKGSAT